MPRKKSYEIDPASKAWQGLTQLQRDWISRYVEHCDAPRAAEEIGKPRDRGHDFMRSAKVKAVLSECARRGMEALDLTVEGVARDLVGILRADPREAYGPDGQRVRVHELPDDLALAATALSVDGEGRVSGLKLESRLGAAKLLGTYLQMFNPTVHVEHAVTLEGYIEHALGEGGAAFTPVPFIDGGAPPSGVDQKISEKNGTAKLALPASGQVVSLEEALDWKEPAQQPSAGDSKDLEGYEEEEVPDDDYDPDDLGGEWEDEDE